MAPPADTPFPRYLSLAELARRVSVGTSAERLWRQLVADLLCGEPDTIVRVFRRGTMRLDDYLAHLRADEHHLLGGTADPLRCMARHIAEEIMVDAETGARIAADYDYALPAWHKAWAAADPPPEPERPQARNRRGRPSRKAEIQRTFREVLTEEERNFRGDPLRWAIRYALHPELRGGREPNPNGLGDTAIDAALKELLAADPEIRPGK
jgi:hypothetical protein